jgi:hypothetical protein
MAPRDAFGRVVLRTVLTVVAVVFVLYLIVLLQRPLTWLVISAFIAIAMSGPVNLLARHMKRGLAVALAYTALVMIPIGLGALLIPSLVGQIENLADNVPEYAQDVTDFVQNNDTLNNLNDKYDITSSIQNAADDLPSKIGDAAGVLQDIGVGVVNSDRPADVKLRRYADGYRINVATLAPHTSGAFAIPADRGTAPWQLAVADGSSTVRVCALGDA